MHFKKFIFNTSAWRRIIYIYIPVFLGGYLLLSLIGFFLPAYDQRPIDPEQSFAGQTPIVYHDGYNISFFGLEELHPFNSKKYQGVFDILKENGLSNTITATPAPQNLLSTWHTTDYLESLQSSWVLAKVLELRFLRFFPSILSRNLVLEPMRLQTGGSVIAALAALEHGWAINLGGGFHHAAWNNGEGFCALDDIGLTVKFLRTHKNIKKVMIIDLDAHQGNGHGRDFIDDPDVYILDIYNADIYPRDQFAKQAIDLKVELSSFTTDAEYLFHLKNALKKAAEDFTPDFILYNAGTDLLQGDPLGQLDVSEKAIIRRDQLVFAYAYKRKIPIVILLSGGYQDATVPVIAQSILNLKKTFKLF